MLFIILKKIENKLQCSQKFEGEKAKTSELVLKTHVSGSRLQA
jgi:hypothetical protein